MRCCVAAGASVAFGACVESKANLTQADRDHLRGLTIVDAHAHPYQLATRQYDPSTPTCELMNSVGMVACSFSAVGDLVRYGGRSGSAYSDTLDQLQSVLRLERKQEVRRILSSADLTVSNPLPGAIMAIEGGDALEGRLENVAAFYDLGVRMMTLVHDHDNGIGFNCRSNSDGPLTHFGIQVVERMNQIGMLIDVAHARTKTLKSIAAVSAAPLIDSHTSPLPYGIEPSQPVRLRTWTEMEWIAKTGGMICTWPLATSGGLLQRTTLKHWGEEIALMKSRLGIEHCGFGSDSGGGLPKKVKGWVSYGSIPRLIDAMGEAGLSRNDVFAYFGGNLLGLLQKTIG